MNKVVIIIVVAIVIGAGAWFGINKDSKTAAPPMDMSHSASTSQSQEKAQPVTTDKITIQNYTFTPANITVKKGTTVTWTNDDTIPHTVTENDGQNGPKSQELAPGKSYTFAFSNAGTYKYECSLHPYMTGVVTVT